MVSTINTVTYHLLNLGYHLAHSNTDTHPNHVKTLSFLFITMLLPGNTKGGKYHCTIDLLFDWFFISCTTTDNFCFYLQNTLIQTSQTGGQQYSDTSPLSIPCYSHVISYRWYWLNMKPKICTKHSFYHGLIVPQGSVL
jgi:hypothetical protein